MRRLLMLILGLGGLFGLSGCGTTGPREVQTGPVLLAPRQQGGGGAVRPPPPRVVAPEAWEAEAESWIGTPYRVGGTDRGGVDCSGFSTQMYLRVTTMRLPRRTIDQFRSGRAVARRDLRPGDLVFFDTTGAGVSHVGVIVDSDRFAHASTSRGVRYSRLSEEYWNRRYLGGRRIP